MPRPATAPVTVDLVEVGPRDGLQNESRTLPVDTRIDLVHRLVAGGVRRLEAVSFVRPDRVPQMAGAEEVMAGLADLTARDDVSLIGLVLNRKGAERAAAAACDEINVVVPVTDEFSVRNQGVPVDGMLDHAAAAVAVGRDAGMAVSVTLAVAFGCPFHGVVTTDDVRRVVDRVADLGIDELAYADTVGVGVPGQVLALGGILTDGPGDRVPNLRFHFHNTRNTGYANAYAATTLDLSRHGGRVALDASVGGFGGCPFAPAATGNIAMEDLVYQLERAGTPTTVDAPAIDGLVETAAWLAGELDSPVQALLGKAGDFPGSLG